MTETQTTVRPILGFLKELKGDNVFISGDCLLSSPFNVFTTIYTGLRPVFLLQPRASTEKLVLVMDGDIRLLGDGGNVDTKSRSLHFYNSSRHICIFFGVASSRKIRFIE